MPSVRQDPCDPDFVQNPYEFYRQIRALGDFVFWEDFGFPVAVTRESVAQVMRHPHMGRAVPEDQKPNKIASLEPFYAVEKHSLLELEPPDHTRMRRVVAKAFALNRMAPLSLKVSQIADQLISAFPTTEDFDLIETFTQPLTALSITSFLGVDTTHADQLRTWSDAMVAMYQSRRDSDIENAAAKAASEFSQFASDELDRRKKMSTDDFLSELVEAESAGLLSRPELISTVILLLNAGQEATAHAIGNAIRTLMNFPERSLALQPEQIANTTEECLRHTPPLHMFTRQVYRATELSGISILAGSKIGCLLGSACRDDAVWPDGEKFDPFRMRHNHQAFGVGIHACTGAALARLEMQIALPALFSRCPKLTITEPPRVANRYHFHGLEALLVKLEEPAST